MQNFFDLLKEVWTSGFLGIDLGSLISSLLVLLAAFLFRGFIISVILNALGRLAESTESKIDDEILNALRRPIGLVPVTIALYICTLILPLSGLILPVDFFRRLDTTATQCTHKSSKISRFFIFLISLQCKKRK